MFSEPLCYDDEAAVFFERCKRHGPRMSPWVRTLHESDTGPAAPGSETHGRYRIDISMCNKRGRESVEADVGQQGCEGQSGQMGRD